MRIRPYHPYRSAYESRYARWLEEHRLAGDLLSWRYEPETFALAARTTYTPDFEITRLDGSREFVEVKGWSRSLHTSRTKWKIAADKYRQYRWLWVTWNADKGCWKHEEYKHADDDV